MSWPLRDPVLVVRVEVVAVAVEGVVGVVAAVEVAVLIVVLPGGNNCIQDLSCTSAAEVIAIELGTINSDSKCRKGKCQVVSVAIVPYCCCYL